MQSLFPLKESLLFRAGSEIARAVLPFLWEISVYGCPDFKAGAAESIFNIVSNTNLNHAVEVTSGVCEEECAAVLKDFFKKRREENKQQKQK